MANKLGFEKDLHNEEGCVMKFGLFGAGGFGREVMVTLLRRQWSKGAGQQFTEYVFVETKPTVGSVDGVRVISEQEFDASEYTHFAISIADATVRQKLAERMEGKGKIPTTIVSELASVSKISKIGAGSIFSDLTIVTANGIIGRHFHCNIFSYVAHDCVVGDFVTFAPSVRCNGNVHVGHRAYIGTGAVIKQGTPTHPVVIEDAATVGMGAVVTRSVPAGMTVVGNPARELVKR